MHACKRPLEPSRAIRMKDPQAKLQDDGEARGTLLSSLETWHQEKGFTEKPGILWRPCPVASSKKPTMN